MEILKAYLKWVVYNLPVLFVLLYGHYSNNSQLILVADVLIWVSVLVGFILATVTIEKYTNEEILKIEFKPYVNKSFRMWYMLFFFSVLIYLEYIWLAGFYFISIFGLMHFLNIREQLELKQKELKENYDN